MDQWDNAPGCTNNGNRKAKINASLMIQAGGRLFLFVLHDFHVAIIFSFF
ncbi:hypothetical protein ACWGJQ_21180 [Peribacillus simplex]